MEARREIELKLECEPVHLAALAGHPLLQAPQNNAALLRTVYFDTPAHDLHKAGLSLRVRDGGGATVQTLKATSSAAGLFNRPEWEWEIAGDAPDRALLKGTPAADVLADAPALAPVFRIMVERTLRPIRHGGSEIAVTLDAGRIETDKGDAPICELELELADGSESDLFALVTVFAETVPLRLSVLSKGERGYALIEETLRSPTKAPKIAFEEMTTGAAFVRIAQSCVKHLRLNEAVWLKSRDAEALHQMRVALRRLRSAFALFKPMLSADPQSQVLRDAVKRVGEPFGKARNLDVFLGDTLEAEIVRRPDEPGLHALRERVQADRDRAYDAVAAVLADKAWRSLLIELVAWVEVGPWRQGETPHRDGPAADFAAAVLERLRRRIKKRGRNLDRLSPEDRHRVRIEAKKLRYGAEFFGALFSDKKARRRHKAFVAALSDLQDHLGALNDLATAHTIADDLAARRTADGGADTGAALFAAGLTAADMESRAGALLAHAARAHEELVDVRRFWPRG